MYGEFALTARSPYLALLGDIGNSHDDRLYDFLERQLQRFKIVFFVIGNHEPYLIDDAGPVKCTYEAAVAKMQAFEASIASRQSSSSGHDGGNRAPGRFVLLNRRRFDISDQVTVLGCTLFSRISDDQQSTAALFVSDFSNIQDWSTDAHNAAHATDLQWLNTEVDSLTRTEPSRAIAIFTHYSPTNSTLANDPEHLEDSRGVQTAFVTDLEREVCWTSPSVKLWAFGHTHFNCDFVDPGTGKRVVANQRGYGREDAFDFDSEKVVSIGH